MSKATKIQLIPKDIMEPIGAEGTKMFKKCADTWMDSEVAQLRALLPAKYHGVPLDWCKIEWVRFRKAGTEGYRVNGHGPKKGSRKKAKKPPYPKGYKRRLEQDDWKKEIIPSLKAYWSNRCAACNVTGDQAILDGHHRTYDRFGHEDFTDIILLCRRCHNLFHENVKVDEKQKGLF